ncbi:hypothetical protein BKA82DRAFT_24619 [Pisolithus tinctorius]|uniref:Uncharacterized protein n=1 Tax=Pisolithus tinctorius Marx 270 TaxID=870435 RepID=A0A0C3NZW1_PISTI|nr:hypothetical protein BKA82DRAFT_24619 [Pisolithus tinctorius]KIO06375.1 hypothetical protein M404DRAFT_24619 [Pisolithus tinctorius Marx 270]
MSSKAGAARTNTPGIEIDDMYVYASIYRQPVHPSSRLNRSRYTFGEKLILSLYTATQKLNQRSLIWFHPLYLSTELTNGPVYIDRALSKIDEVTSSQEDGGVYGHLGHLNAAVALKSSDADSWDTARLVETGAKKFTWVAGLLWTAETGYTLQLTLLRFPSFTSLVKRSMHKCTFHALSTYSALASSKVQWGALLARRGDQRKDADEPRGGTNAIKGVIQEAFPSFWQI